MAYTFQTINFTGETLFTQALGINDSDTIVGAHDAAANAAFSDSNGTFTTLTPPGSTAADAVGINNSGTVTGFYLDGNGVTNGFIESTGSSGPLFTTLDAPNTAFNQLLGINDKGELAGYSSDMVNGLTDQLAYFVNAGSYTYLDNATHTALLPTNVNSQATDINNVGQVVGFFMPTATTSDGFIDNNGKLTVLSAPGSTFTQALGENNEGQVVGFYNDTNGMSHGFVYSAGNYTTVDVPSASATTINGINDAGQVAGFSVNQTGSITTGFTTSLPEAELTDTTTGTSWQQAMTAYSGPVNYLTSEFVDITSDNLNMSTTQANVFLHSGSGNDALQVTSGQNVLDGGTGSNFLTGGTGTGAGAGSDTFFVDDRGATAPIWSTLANFHAGDAATVWGVTAQDFNLSWVDGQGASGYTGLTLHATASGSPTASLTLVGYSSADLTDGKLSVSYGNSGGSNYMYIHANG